MPAQAGAPPPVETLADVAVVIPARNAEGLIEACLVSVMASRAAEVIVVDGESKDLTAAIARMYGARVISDNGAGLPAARMIGAGATTCPTVVLIDADVVLSDGALEALVGEMKAGNYVALQAGLESTGGPGYWGRALAMHHRTGRSRSWFGLVATAFCRDKLLEYGFDDMFSSGEDIDVRWRLKQAGERIAVSTDIVVEHRFAGDDFAFARGQWRMDGHGLGLMVRRHGARGLPLLLLPAAAALRGAGLSLLRLQPEWLVYYAAFAWFNYAAMGGVLVPQRLRRAGSLVENALGLLVSKGAAMALGLSFWLIAAHVTGSHEVGLAAASVSAMMLCTQLAILGIGSAFIAHVADGRRPADAVLDSALTLVVALSVVFGVAALSVLSVVPAFAPLVSPVYAVLFVLLVVLGTLGILFDHVAVSFGRGRNIALRGAVAGALPVFALLIPPLSDGATARTLLALWLPGLLATVVWGWVLVRRELPGYAYQKPAGTALVSLVRTGVPNWCLTLSDRVPGLVLPLVVTQLMSPADNAHWYVVWMTAWAVYSIPNAVGIAAFAEVAAHPEQVRSLTRRALGLALVLGVSGAAAAAIAGPGLLSLFGTGYRDAGVEPLLVLLVGVVPLAVIQVRYATCRAMGRLTPAVTVGALTTLAGVGLAATVGVRHGLLGVAVSWVATLVVAAPVSLLLVPRARTEPEPELAVLEEHLAPKEHLPPEETLPTSSRASLLLVAAGVWLWVSGSRSVDLSAMSDFGVASVLTARMWAGLVVLSLAVGVALVHRRPPHWVLALNVVATCVCFFGLSSWLSDVPRSAVTFRHAGITSALIQSGSVDRSIDAYFDWPGFFAGAATVTRAAGVGGPIDFALWAPLVVNLLCLPPVLLLLSSLTRDRRSVWFAAWLFFALNWINQDYFAPQSFDYVLYLTVLALLVRLFRPGRNADPDRARPAAVLVVLLLCAAIIPAHQLTPFALLTVVTALVLMRRCTLVFLPLILLTAIVFWDGYVALPYISGHAQTLFGSIGDVNSAASANVASRVNGSPDHLVVVRIRLGIAIAVWSVAGLYSLARLFRRTADLTVLALAWSPLLLIPTQPYGGEMLLRVFWFALPGVSLLLAQTLLPAARRGHVTLGMRHREAVSKGAHVLAVVRWSLLGAGAVGLLLASFVARYGNERMDNFTSQEVAGTRAMYDIAGTHAVIVAGFGSFPWKSEAYTEHSYVELKGLWVPGKMTATAALLARRMRQAPDGAVFVVTRSQVEGVDMLGILPAGSLQRLSVVLDNSPGFRTVYRNPDVHVWEACGSKGAPC